jgi:hypothetical protein
MLQLKQTTDEKHKNIGSLKTSGAKLYCMLYERFAILLKSRFHHIYISSISYFFHKKMLFSYTGRKHQKYSKPIEQP